MYKHKYCYSTAVDNGKFHYSFGKVVLLHWISEKKRLVNLLDKSQLALRGKNLYVKTYNKAIKHNILLRINEACVPVQMSIGLYFSQVSDVSEL